MCENIVWLFIPGGVACINCDYLNSKIDEYNRSKFLVSTGDFWGWLSWEEGEEFRGIFKADDISKIHYIKGKDDR